MGGQTSKINVGGIVASVLTENAETVGCTASVTSWEYAALIKDNIQCNVDISQSVTTNEISCAAVLNNTMTVFNALVQSLTDVAQSNGITEYGGTTTQAAAETIATSFIDAYTSQCGAYALSYESVVIKDSTISCCESWELNPSNGLTCTSIGNLDITQTIASPRIQCGINAALQTAATPPPTPGSNPTTITNTPSDIPWWIFVPIVVVLIVIIVVLVRKMAA